MDPMESIKATFFQECEELLGDLETGLLALEAGEGDEDTVNAIFRAVHSVKGGAGAFGLDDLVGFAHVFETSLDMMRSGQLQPDAANVAILLRAGDILADLVAAAQGGPDIDRDRRGASLRELESLTGGPDQSDAEADNDGDIAGDEIEGLEFTPAMISLDGDEPQAEESDGPSGWRITFRPASDMYAKANDVALLLRELERLGPCRTITDTSGLPALDDLDPEASYLVWTVELSANVGRDAVEEVFEFVEDDCELSIEPLSGASLSGEAPDSGGSPDVSELLKRVQAEAPDIPVDVPDDPDPEPAAEQKTVKPSDDPAKKAAISLAPPATIRVDLDRVDRLIDLVGELVINQAMLAERVNENIGEKDNSLVSMALDDLEQLTREIQDSCMAIRAQPVKSVFQRMPRLVRETAAMVKKKVRLVTEGEGTEVDKTVIERLTEPLTHMVRNAIDHGLETPADRAAAGKPEEGVVRLAAMHRSGRIVLEISDDGRGINRDRVRQKAIERGIIEAEAKLSNEEIDNLIFAPGFSTADEVTDVSGRGVGMDVVKRSIQALGGRLSINSTPGEGSVFTMSLPLTLAVLDGMVVNSGEQTLVVPLTAIMESLQPRPENIKQIGSAGTVLQVRDQYVPLIDIGMKLGYRTNRLNPSDGVAILVETEGGGKAALLLDEIRGQRQVVIKSLEQNYRRVEGIAAATIMGDGRVALILDVDAVIASKSLNPASQTPQLAKAS